MGGFFGVASKCEILSDVFFGADYHSHLGTATGGIAIYDKEKGLQRTIHNISNSPFRAKFEHVFEEMTGTSAIGSINDSDPQPLLIRSNIGNYAICTIGIINNSEDLIKNYLSFSGGHFSTMTGGKINSTELVASLINQKSNFIDGIQFAQSQIEGSMSIMILKEDSNIIVARDKVGRIPIFIGKDDDGYCASFESFVYKKLGYVDEKELGPGEIVEISSDGITELVKPGSKMRICSFLWTYYGYPASNYEGINVELMRYKNGEIMANNDNEFIKNSNIDYIGGVPDSGTPHAIGYSAKSGIAFARAFIKYTPTWSRSFISPRQTERAKVAKMKQLPVCELIKDKNLMFIDDSIVRGTQLRETVEFLYDNGAKSVHIRSACPPIMYPCKYLNFSRSNGEMELLGRKIIDELEGDEGVKHIEEYADSASERGQKFRECICKKLNLASLEFQSLQGLIDAIGLDECKLCTYCYNKKE
ncbi:MAG: amidophosphoribosyltransferase [Eubacteriales bacterium]